MNKVLFKSLLINISYKYYSIMDKDLIIELQLPREKIPSKPVTRFINENIKEPGVEITKILKFCIDIQGYKRNIFTYVVLVLLNLIVIQLL